MILLKGLATVEPMTPKVAQVFFFSCLLKAASVSQIIVSIVIGLLFESKKRTSEWQISMNYHEWTPEMDYLNGPLNGLPK